MTATTLDALYTIRQRIAAWVDRLPPIMAVPEPRPETELVAHETLVVVHTGGFTFWLISLLPGWEEITREEAAQFILQREVRVRYQPLIVEMDRKTILNEIK